MLQRSRFPLRVFTRHRRNPLTETCCRFNHGNVPSVQGIVSSERQLGDDWQPLIKGLAGFSGIFLTGQLLLGNTNSISCDDREDEGTDSDSTSTSSTTKRLEVGGVKGEFRKEQRKIQSIDPPLLDFFSKEIIVKHGSREFPIRAHECVADAALYVAADRLSRMLRHLPPQILDRLLRCQASFHVIGVEQGTSDLPEHNHMRGVPGGYTKEDFTLDERCRGMGGVQSSCGEENLIDLDSDPRYEGMDVLSHEFAHCIMDIGLPPVLQEEIRNTFEKSVTQKQLWMKPGGTNEGVYAATNPHEYFAEMSMWYFGTRGEYVDAKKKWPPPGPGGLQAYDKDGFELLASIYGGTHPALKEPDPPIDRLAPLPERHHASEDLDDKKVTLQFDNSGCNCSWKLFWVDGEGKRREYNRVVKGTNYLQRTFPGHVWELELDDSASDDSLCPKPQKVLQYEASHSPVNLAAIAEDSRCKKPTTKETDPPFVRLKPLLKRQASEDLDSEEVTLQIDNSGGNCAWQLYWVDREGKRERYDTVQKGSKHLQHTYSGHVWELELDDDECEKSPGTKKVLHYVASSSPVCLAAVAKDSSPKKEHTKENEQSIPLENARADES